MITPSGVIGRHHVKWSWSLWIWCSLCKTPLTCALYNTAGQLGQSLRPRHEIYELPRAVNSLSHTSSYLKGQPFRPSGVVNLALCLPDKPDTRITIPHPSLTLKPLIPRYTKQKQPPLTRAPKSQEMKKKKVLWKVFCTGANSLQWVRRALMNRSCCSAASRINPENPAQSCSWCAY